MCRRRSYMCVRSDCMCRENDGRLCGGVAWHVVRTEQPLQQQRQHRQQGQQQRWQRLRWGLTRVVACTEPCIDAARGAISPDRSYINSKHSSDWRTSRQHTAPLTATPRWLVSAASGGSCLRLVYAARGDLWSRVATSGNSGSRVLPSRFVPSSVCVRLIVGAVSLTVVLLLASLTGRALP